MDDISVSGHYSASTKSVTVIEQWVVSKDGIYHIMNNNEVAGTHLGGYGWKVGLPSIYLPYLTLPHLFPLRWMHQ